MPGWPELTTLNIQVKTQIVSMIYGGDDDDDDHHHHHCDGVAEAEDDDDDDDGDCNHRESGLDFPFSP